MRRLALIALLILSAACGTPSDGGLDSVDVPVLPGGSLSPGGDAGLPPILDADSVARGKTLYDRNCAACHGTTLEGAADWQVPLSDGSYRPPPHNSTGHTWHHSDQLLIDVVLNGSSFPQARMPTFAGRLDRADVVAILDYFKSTWGDLERQTQWERTVADDP